MTSLKGQGWSTTICKSPTVDTSKKCSIPFERTLISEDAQVLDLKTNVLIWGLFMPTTKKASVHLGPNYNENLKGYRNTKFEDVKNLFDITQSLIMKHAAEILNVSTIEWTFLPLDEIFTVARSSDQVDESKSTRLHRFRVMSGEGAGPFRSKQKMDRSVSILSFIS